MISARVVAVVAVVVPTLALGALSPVALKMLRSEPPAPEAAPAVESPVSGVSAPSKSASEFWNSASIKTLKSGSPEAPSSLSASVSNLRLREAVTQASDELKQSREDQKQTKKKQRLLTPFDEASLLAASADTAAVPASDVSEAASLAAATEVLLDPAQTDLIAPEAISAGLVQDGSYPTPASIGTVELANVKPGPGIKSGPGISADEGGSSGSNRSRSARQETIASFPTDFGSNGFDDSFSNFGNPGSNQGSNGPGQPSNNAPANNPNNPAGNGVTPPSNSTNPIFDNDNDSGSDGNGVTPTVPGPGAGALAFVALIGLAKRRRA